jgi:hypothetical protein
VNIGMGMGGVGKAEEGEKKENSRSSLRLSRDDIAPSMNRHQSRP